MDPGRMPIILCPAAPAGVRKDFVNPFPKGRSPVCENSLSIQNAASTAPLVPVPLPWHNVSARNDTPASMRLSSMSAFAASRSFSHPLCAKEEREIKHDKNMQV